MMLGRRKRKPALQTWCAAAQPRCDVHVAGCFRDRAQTGACHSGRHRLHNVGQITRRLSDVNVVHEGVELVGIIL